MRWNGFLISIALAAVAGSAPLLAANFGTVVPIAGHSSDIALDESRGLLYIANFTANRIEVMSTSDGSIRSSMNVAAQPGAISLSPDNQFLIVAHFGNYDATQTQPAKNAITLINLGDNTRQTFAMGDTPLGVQFIADGRAFIVTNTSLVLFDPVSGAMQVVATFATLAKTLPVDPATFPSQVILASLATSPNRRYVYGIADDGSRPGVLSLRFRHRLYFCDRRHRLAQAAAPDQRLGRRLLGHHRPVQARRLRQRSRAVPELGDLGQCRRQCGRFQGRDHLRTDPHSQPANNFRHFILHTGGFGALRHTAGALPSGRG